MSKTILIVDDDAAFIQPLRKKLCLDGYTVMTAHTGEKAMARLKQYAISLVLLDMMEPHLEGLHICRQIRSHTALPIMVLSACQGTAEKVLLLESGADDYLVKPFDYLELLARIQARMRRDLSFILNESQKPIQIGPLSMHPQTRWVAFKTRKAQLTQKEYDILTLLCEHAGKVLERRVIRNALWPQDRIYQWSRTIDVHIQHLRKKLEPDPSAPELIRTVKGAGYTLSIEPIGPQRRGADKRAGGYAISMPGTRFDIPDKVPEVSHPKPVHKCRLNTRSP